MDRFAFLEEDWGRTIKVEIRSPGHAVHEETPCP